MTVPDSSLMCGVDIYWAYVPDTKKVYVCEGSPPFVYYHEDWHYYYDNIITRNERLAYNRMYWNDRVIWISAFYSWYSFSDAQEDFADLYALMMLKQNSNPYVMKRIRFIKRLIKNHE